ncbi:G-protein coupled receptor GRL101, partial [Stylophora pistillata]
MRSRQYASHEVISNSPKVIGAIPSQEHATEIVINSGQDPITKTLGLPWNSSLEFQTTKRNVLRKVATIFDPLGFVCSYVIVTKILLQELWMLGYDWDDEVQDERANQIGAWFEQLKIPHEGPFQEQVAEIILRNVPEQQSAILLVRNALEAIRGLAVTAHEYEEAKEVLKTTCGDTRRLLRAYLDTLEQAPLTRGNDIHALEKFADLVRISGKVTNRRKRSGIRFEKTRIIVQIRSPFLIGLCEHVMMDRNYFNMASDMGGKEWWLGNNNFKELPDELLAGQDALKYLRLGGNHLKQLPRNIFKDLSELEVLDLSYNQLQKLPRGVLSNTTRLKKLDLSNNDIQRLPSDVFNNVTQLKRLFLSNNKLRQLPSFKNLSQLSTLAAYENKIQYLPPRVFEGAKNLKSMSFHLNNIPSVSNVLFEDVAPSIRFMYFHYNEMRVLPEGFFANMEKLITATVDTNLMCCHLTKEDADCDFVYVDSFASCESMFRNPAPRKCIWVIGILSLVGAVFVIVWRLVFKEKRKKNKIQSIMLMHLAGSDGLMGVYLIIV